MKRFRDIVLPITAVLLFAAVVQFTLAGGGICMLAVAALTLCGLIFGRSLPVSLRVFITGLVVYFGCGMCIAGRAMAPGFTVFTAGKALTMFSVFAIWPILSLLRLWPRRLAIRLISGAVPVCFVFAFLAADIEERLFVRRYRETGIGPTPRWTDSSSWLSYDAQTHQLNGSD